MGEMNTDFQTRGRRRRVVGLGISAVAFIFLTIGSLFTVVGQNLDNLSMEALLERAVAVPRQLSLFTSLVSIPAVIIVSVFVVIIALIRRRMALAFRAVAVVVGANLTTQILKEFILWRPDLGVSWLLDNSYPSGHTTFAASVAVALIMVSPRGFRFAAAVFGWVWTTLMGIVVIAQGWHRLSDVLGAILVVAIWGFLLAPIESRHRVLPSVVRVGGYLSWVMLAVGAFLFGVATVLAWGDIQIPLSRETIESMVQVGQVDGKLFTVGTCLLIAGLSAVVVSTVDRFSGETDIM